MAAGIAATRGKLNKLFRVWTIGNGIGFGRFPSREGIWEGGHSVVTLDPKENFCGCGGKAISKEFLDAAPSVCVSWISNRGGF